ncbi:MAG TPA: HAMP domain-containing sensor histidine kinase, partial [Candidatus Dormibacteraeota bacterium]|nr:HAMP domain-containing sensor histidine kinase [Candidatus Dormibacteraeota bacterium]
FGDVTAASFPQTWAVWWTGDAMGVLLVAPFLLCFRPVAGRPALTWRQRAELAALLGTVAIVTFVVFQTQLRLEYLVLPLIMLAALRFRLRGAAPAALIASGVAVLAAVNGTGPFANESLLEEMVTLQVFNVFVALASFVLASYVDTRESAQRARVANETKSEFLRVAAHELRGPLSVLSGYLSLLSSGDLGKPPEKWRGPLDILAAKTWELNNIMDELLEVVRLDAELGARDRKSVDLRDIVAAAAERARPRAALSGGEISVENAGVPLVVIADANQLGHVLDNLINNGVSYSREPALVSIRTSIEGERALARVSDRGVGVPASMRDSMFEPFRRGDQAGFEDVAGTGLGLYLSRELVTAHGGTLTLEKTTPGVGSTFLIALPLAVTEPTFRA